MKSVVIIGGGYSGMGAAYRLLKEGYEVTVIEKNPVLGGLASSFTLDNKFLPLGYHHILQNETALLDVIKDLGLYEKLDWKNAKMFFYMNGLWNLRNPMHFLRMPLSLWAKFRFTLFMLTSFMRNDWSTLQDVGADQWLSKAVGKEVKEAIFDPLLDIKFAMGACNVSAAWLGARLAKREGSSKFGYIPGADWTREVIVALGNHVKQRGKISCDSKVQQIKTKNGKVAGVVLENGKNLPADLVISTVPTTIFSTVLPEYAHEVSGISYINTISCLVGTEQPCDDFYWIVAVQPRLHCGGMFQLTNLNPTLTHGEAVLNFFTHVLPENPFWKKTDNDIIAAYKKDFEQMFGYPLHIQWAKVNRIKNTSPRFVKGYRNPPVKSALSGLYYAGNYRTYPLITSTSTALASGIETAEIIIRG